MEEETAMIDMASQVDGWKQGVQDGEAHAKTNLLMPNTVKLTELALPSAPGAQADEGRHRDWMSGYRRGFREGIQRAED